MSSATLRWCLLSLLGIGMMIAAHDAFAQRRFRIFRRPPPARDSVPSTVVKPAAAAPAKTEIAADVKAAAAANNRFALDLYGELRAREGNQFFSPVSITTSLALAS